MFQDDKNIQKYQKEFRAAALVLQLYLCGAYRNLRNKTQKGWMLYETDPTQLSCYDNEDDVTTSLTKHKFSVTRLSTTGGFLKKGNTTLMIVTEPERVDEAIDIIKKECGHHQKITINMPYVSGSSMVHCATMPMSVDVGGATIFVVGC